MDYNDYAMKMWEAYQKKLENESDADYEVDEKQMGKLIDAYEFLDKHVKRCEQGTARIEEIELSPKETSGGITAYFSVFYLFDDDLTEFAKILGDSVGLSIEPTLNDTVCISFTIPNIFRHK